jgi:hypothetical protein
VSAHSTRCPLSLRTLIYFVLKAKVVMTCIKYLQNVLPFLWCSLALDTISEPEMPALSLVLLSSFQGGQHEAVNMPGSINNTCIVLPLILNGLAVQPFKIFAGMLRKQVMKHINLANHSKRMVVFIPRSTPDPISHFHFISPCST